MREKMDITSAQYAKINGLLLGINATINGKECSVPINMTNSHYVEILSQLEEEGLVIKYAE